MHVPFRIGPLRTYVKRFKDHELRSGALSEMLSRSRRLLLSKNITLTGTSDSIWNKNNGISMRLVLA